MNKYYNGKTNNGIRLYEYDSTRSTDRLGCLAEIRRMFQGIANNIEALESMHEDLKGNLTYGDEKQRARNAKTEEEMLPNGFYDNVIEYSIENIEELLNDCEEAFTRLAKRAYPYTRIEESFNPRSSQYINRKRGDTGRFRK